MIREIGDRKYRIEIYIGRDGKHKKTRTKTVDLSHMKQSAADKEIRIIEREFEKQLRSGWGAGSDMTLRQFVDGDWWNLYVTQNLRPKTMDSYRRELDRRILPELGYLKLSEISPIHLSRFYAKLTKHTYKRGGKSVPVTVHYLAPRTIKYQHQILSSILGQAKLWGLIEVNPCRNVVPPKQDKTKSNQVDKEKYWQKKYIETFLIAIQSEKLKYICAAELAIIGGLRTEEILGLDLNDISDHGIEIRRTSKIIGKSGMLVEDQTKNKKSRRSVALPPTVISHLRQLAHEQKVSRFKLQNMWSTERYHGTLLFTQDDGSPMYGTTLNGWLRAFIKRYNKVHSDDPLPLISFHGLRHTNAALMVYFQVDNKVGANRMGHSTTSTFLNMYGGVMEEADEIITAKFGDFLSGLQK